MLTNVKIGRFQSIKEADLQLDQFTVIVGQSSTGKSALCRAIRALIRNDTHYSYVSRGFTAFSVMGQFEDLRVAIERGKSHSTYKLLNGKEQSFDKSGRAVPSDVSKVFNMAEIEDIDLHLTTQFDQPLLLTEASTVPAKVLGSFSHAHKMYAASDLALKKRSQANSELKAYREQLTSLVQQIEGLDPADLSIEDIDSVLEDISKLRTKIKTISKVTSVVASIEAARQYVIVTRKSKAKVESLIQLEFTKLSKLNTLTEKAKNMQVVSDIVSRLDKAASQYKALAAQRDSISQALEKEHIHLVDLQQTLTICPTCGQPVGEK